MSLCFLPAWPSGLAVARPSPPPKTLLNPSLPFSLSHNPLLSLLQTPTFNHHYPPFLVLGLYERKIRHRPVCRVLLPMPCPADWSSAEQACASVSPGSFVGRNELGPALVPCDVQSWGPAADTAPGSWGHTHASLPPPPLCPEQPGARWDPGNIFQQERKTGWGYPHPSHSPTCYRITTHPPKQLSSLPLGLKQVQNRNLHWRKDEAAGGRGRRPGLRAPGSSQRRETLGHALLTEVSLGPSGLPTPHPRAWEGGGSPREKDPKCPMPRPQLLPTICFRQA